MDNHSDGSGEAGVLPLGGELHNFSIKQEQLFKIDALHEKGAFFIRNALQDGEAKLVWVRFVVVQGLIGGGNSPVEAEEIVQTHIDEPGDWIVASILATNILTVGLSGPIVENGDANEAEDGETTDPKG